jgi:hypothetical protein
MSIHGPRMAWQPVDGGRRPAATTVPEASRLIGYGTVETGHGPAGRGCVVCMAGRGRGGASPRVVVGRVGGCGEARPTGSRPPRPTWKDRIIGTPGFVMRVSKIATIPTPRMVHAAGHEPSPRSSRAFRVRRPGQLARGSLQAERVCIVDAGHVIEVTDEGLRAQGDRGEEGRARHPAGHAAQRSHLRHRDDLRRQRQHLRPAAPEGRPASIFPP